MRPRFNSNSIRNCKRCYEIFIKQNWLWATTSTCDSFDGLLFSFLDHSPGETPKKITV